MNPCRHCEQRHLRCHSNCPDYDSWKAAVEKARENRKRELEAESFVLRPVPGKNNRKVKK
jgi:hypothetical protein